LCFIFWELDFGLIGASFVKGSAISIEILLIVFGAIWLLEVLKVSGKIEIIQSGLISLSKDVRVQAVLIAWLFGSLIEGVAGFGAPAALAAPLLVSIGFSPLASIVIALIANSSSVSFGAAGTPVLLGLGGLGFDSTLLGEVSKNAAIMHFFAGLFVPLIIVYFITHVFDKSRKGEARFREIIPFALFSGLAFLIPYYLLAVFVGPELPSIFGGLIGLFVVGFAAKKNFLIPKKTYSFKSHKKIGKFKGKEILFSLIPYILIVVLLSLSRIIGSWKEFLQGISLGWEEIFGFAVSYSFNPFYTPSFYFILSALVGIFIFRINKKEIKLSLKNSVNRLEKPAIALIFILALVQLFIVSEMNSLGISSIPLLLAERIGSFLGEGFVFISPFIGAFGTFIAGSNTVSNLLFGSFQAETAMALGLSIAVILALQLVGGAFGNMISIHNVLAASATVGYHGEEGTIIRKTLIVVLIYGLIVGVVGFLILSFSG